MNGPHLVDITVLIDRKYRVAKTLYTFWTCSQEMHIRKSNWLSNSWFFSSNFYVTAPTEYFVRPDGCCSLLVIICDSGKGLFSALLVTSFARHWLSSSNVHFFFAQCQIVLECGMPIWPLRIETLASNIYLVTSYNECECICNVAHPLKLCFDSWLVVYFHVSNTTVLL